MPVYEADDRQPSRPAASALSTERVFLAYNSSNKLDLAAAGGVADGVQRYAVSATGDEVTIETAGNMLVTCGGTVAAFDEVMSDSAGKAVKWTAGNVKLGLCLIGAASGAKALIKFYDRAQSGQSQASFVALSVNGAIPVRPSQNYIITKAGVLADTLAAPTAVTDDGVTIVVTSSTANAHTITATGLLNTGSASVNVATFAAFAGASVTLQAYNGKWNVLASTGITFS